MYIYVNNFSKIVARNNLSETCYKYVLDDRIWAILLKSVALSMQYKIVLRYYIYIFRLYIYKLFF